MLVQLREVLRCRQRSDFPWCCRTKDYRMCFGAGEKQRQQYESRPPPLEGPGSTQQFSKILWKARLGCGIEEFRCCLRGLRVQSLLHTTCFDFNRSCRGRRAAASIFAMLMAQLGPSPMFVSRADGACNVTQKLQQGPCALLSCGFGKRFPSTSKGPAQLRAMGERCLRHVLPFLDGLELAKSEQTAKAFPEVSEEEGFSKGPC